MRDRSCAVLALIALVGCTDRIPPAFPGPPVLASIDGATTPQAAPGATIEIVGTVSGATKVRFVQGSATIDVTPVTVAGMSLTVDVPASFLAPGTATVTVLSAAFPTGSNPLTLTIAPVASFDPSGVAWTATGTTPLPSPRRAHAAVAVPVDSTHAWLYVIGGNDGTNDLASVLVAPLDSIGDVGSWQATNPLPGPLAFMAIAEADPSNALVPVGTGFVYVIGGQQAAGDQPGGSVGALVGSVTLSTGQISWSPTATPLFSNVPLAGLKATNHRGFLYVTGGLAGADSQGSQITPVGDASGFTYVAQVLPSGMLSSLTTTLNPPLLPVPVGLHETFASNGFLYVVGGDLGPETAPYPLALTKATGAVWFAPVSQGSVGAWTAGSMTLRAREKLSSFLVAGDILLFEGAYGATDLEGEWTSLGSNGSTGAFVAETGTALPGLDVFDGAGVTSPLLDASNQPHLILVGGDSVASPGSLSAAVLRTGP